MIGATEEMLLQDRNVGEPQECKDLEALAVVVGQPAKLGPGVEPRHKVFT
jgi:hypothetical protein